MRDAPFDLLVLGPFPRDRVVTRFDGPAMPSSPEIKRLIDAAWSRHVHESAELGQMLFIGQMARLTAWSVHDGTLEITFGPTDYRQFVGTNLTHPEIAATNGDDALANGTGITTVLRTSDGQLVVHRRSQRVFECPGCLDLCGGSLEPVGGVVDPFTRMEIELQEEMAIEREAIAAMRCLGLSRDGRTRKPEVLLETTIALTAADLAIASGEEFDELVRVPDDLNALSAWMSEWWSEIAPAGLAALTAYAATQFSSAIGSLWSSD